MVDYGFDLGIVLVGMYNILLYWIVGWFGGCWWFRELRDLVVFGGFRFLGCCGVVSCYAWFCQMVCGCGCL